MGAVESLRLCQGHVVTFSGAYSGLKSVLRPVHRSNA